MMEAGLQELLLDSLFTYSLLILGSFLSVFPGWWPAATRNGQWVTSYSASVSNSLGRGRG